MNTVFSPRALDQLQDLIRYNRKLAAKCLKLIDAIERDPYQGEGKPEPLKWKFASYWSRRINDEHRLIYKIENGQLHILSCREHYDD